MTELATNFSKEMIPKINNVLKFVLKNKHSNFYRKKYLKNEFYPVKTYEEFRKIPFLKKAELEKVDVDERTFVANDQIDHYSFSSGTSSFEAIPIPFMRYDEEEFRKNFLNEEKLKEIGVSTIMLLLNPTSNPLLKCLKLKRKYITFVTGDPSNFSLAAKMMFETDVQGIRTTASRLLLFISELEKINFDLKKIKWISLSSETCTNLMLQKFKLKFPNALISIGYGNSEVSGKIGYRCNYLNNNEDPAHFHPGPRLLEITGADEKICQLGVIGEITHTDIEQKASPMIRYKTGDFGRLEKKSCPCGNDLVLILEGRKNYEYLKTEHFTISSRSISDSLKNFHSAIEPRFQMHIRKEELKFKFELWLKLSSESSFSEQKLLSEDIKKTVNDNLKFKEGGSLASLINQNIANELIIKWVPDWGDPTMKSKSIIYENQY